jgi:hypothetical protein
VILSLATAACITPVKRTYDDSDRRFTACINQGGEWIEDEGCNAGHCEKRLSATSAFVADDAAVDGGDPAADDVDADAATPEGDDRDGD